MRLIKAEQVTSLVKQLILQASFNLRLDVYSLLKKAAQLEEGLAGVVLSQLVANANIASEKKIPLCQDCGYASVFITVGEEVQLEGSLTGAVKQGVAEAFQEGYLRQSVISDALWGRDQFKSNPGFLHLELKPGSDFKVEVILKGGGSDNASRLFMLKPTTSENELIDLIVANVAEVAPNACPPIFIGLGVGGSFDLAPQLSKKALLSDFTVKDAGPNGRLAKKLLRAINELGIGPAGLGGQHTALGVAVLTEKCHMASLPVAINIGCNCLRSAAASL